MGLRLILFLLGSLSLAAEENWLATPAPDSPPVNQLHTDGNACGPACLLDSFRSGSPKWRKSIDRIEGGSDSAKLVKMIKIYGRRGSRLDPNRYRWNGRYGINIADLADFANDLRTERWMGPVKTEILFQKERESQADLLKRAHKALSKSMKKGLPPTLRLRRVAWRAPSGSKSKSWLAVKRHYVVLTGLPEKLPRNANLFKVTYHDPWGGQAREGVIRTTTQNSTGLPTLVADFPKAGIGKSLIKKGEPTCLSLSSALGLF